MLRLDPAIHRNLRQLAESRSTSVNKLAVEALAKLATDCESEIMSGGNEPSQAPSSRNKPRSTRSSGPTKVAAAPRKPPRLTKP